MELQLDYFIIMCRLELTCLEGWIVHICKIGFALLEILVSFSFYLAQECNILSVGMW